jgi:hypothetical protein
MDKPMYPLAACLKWGFHPADGVTEEEIEKLCEELRAQKRALIKER